MKTEHLVECTQRDTDAQFFSCLVHVTDHPTHMRWLEAQRLKMFELCCTFAHPKSHLFTTCFIVHSLMYLTHFLPFCSTPPPTQNSLPNTGIRMNPSATPRGGCCVAAWSNKALLQPRAVLFQCSVIDYQVMWMKAMMNMMPMLC